MKISKSVLAISLFLASNAFAASHFGQTSKPHTDMVGFVEGNASLVSFDETLFVPTRCELRIEVVKSELEKYKQTLQIAFSDDQEIGTHRAWLDFDSTKNKILPFFDLGKDNTAFKVTDVAERKLPSTLTLKDSVIKFGFRTIAARIGFDRTVNLGPLGQFKPQMTSHYEDTRYTLSNGVLEIKIFRTLSIDMTGFSAKKIGSAKCRLNEVPALGSVVVPDSN